MKENEVKQNEVKQEEEQDFLAEQEVFEEGDLKYDTTVTSRGAWASLVLGLIGSVAWIIPILGLPITIVGVVLGAMNLKSKKAKGAAISGFVINIVFLSGSIAKGIVDIVKICRSK